MVRAASILILAGALGIYDATAHLLPSLPLGAEVALLGGLIIPLTFALVWLALPVRASLWTLPGTIAFALLAVLFELTDLDIAANYAGVRYALREGLESHE